MTVNGEIHNAYNLHNIKHFATTKETNNFKPIEQRYNSFAEETLKDWCGNLKTDWLKIYRTQRHT